MTLYADDTCEVVWGDSSSECHDRAQEVADKLSEWFTCVGLSLNPKKSEYIPMNRSVSNLLKLANFIRE